MWGNKEKCKNWKMGILGGLTESIYCGLIALLLWNGEKFFNNTLDEAFAPLFVLILLVLSVAVSGVLVFGYSVYLAVEKKYKQAFQTVGITLLTIFVVLVIVFIISWTV